MATATAVSQSSWKRTSSGVAPPAPNPAAVADLEVVRDVALRAVGDDLRDPEPASFGRRRIVACWPPTSAVSASIHSRLRYRITGHSLPGRPPRAVSAAVDVIGRGTKVFDEPARAGRGGCWTGPTTSSS